MNRNEFVIRHKVIQDIIDNLDLQLQELRKTYRKESHLFPNGSIVDVFFKNGETIRGIIDNGWNLDQDTGLFRPNLFNILESGGKGERIQYDYDKEIESIEKIGVTSKCKDCAWRVLKCGRMFCSIRVTEKPAGLTAVEVRPEDIMCEHGSLVTWDAEIPTAKNFQLEAFQLEVIKEGVSK